MKKLFAAAIAAVLTAASANAAINVTGTYTSASNGGLAASLATSTGDTLFTFDNGVASGTQGNFTLSNNNTILSLTNVAAVNGNDFFGTYSAPTGDTTNYLKIGANGTETIANSQTGYNTLSLFWGSPDTFNTITFLDKSGGTLGSISGSSIAGLTSLGQSAQVTLNSDTTFFGVALSSTSNAFELDNVKFTNTTSTAAVPEPASWTMMILGFGAVGYAMRRRNGKIAHHAIG